MKKLLIVAVVAAVLYACEQTKKDRETPTRQCGDYYVEMSFANDGNVLNAIINGDAVALNNVVAASGTRFAGMLNDTDVVLWARGDDWTLYLDDGAPIECK